MQRSSMWLALLMALFRMLLLAFPTNTLIRRLSKPAVTLWTILVVFIVSTAWGWQVMSRKVITPRAVDTSCNGSLVPLKETRYVVIAPKESEEAHHKMTYIYGFVKAFPSLCDLIISIFLVIELRKAAERRKTWSKSDCDKSENTTKLILFMTIFNFLQEVPNGFSHIVSGLFYYNRKLLTISVQITDFAEILPVINSSSHLFICLLMSTQYRKTANSMFCHGKPEVIGFLI
uniref:G_PROTEIN_RECEP_F1_2 domain-containing protein n=1 Tax=Caenorhabditis japonica TaxID=281687 RepID=A0A8R1I4K8_CAEJA